MSPGHRDAVAETHQLRQHLGTGQDGNAPRPRLLQFDILVGHRGRADHDVTEGDVGGPMSVVHPDADSAQVPGHAAFRQIGARYIETESAKHLRDAPHAGAADAHRSAPGAPAASTDAAPESSRSRTSVPPGSLLVHPSRSLQARATSKQ